MIKLEVIGCGDAFATDLMAQSCIYLKYNDLNILIDCGASSAFAIKKSQLKIEEIDIIFISHLHGDHFAGIPFLLMEMAFSKNKRSKTLKIIGPKAISQKVFEIQELLYPGSIEKIKPLIEVFSHEEIDEIEGIKVKYFPVKHSELSDPYGIRLGFGDKSFAYSGDSEWCESLIELSRGVDVFICECFSFSEQINGHLSYKILMTKIDLLKYNKIFLTHIGEDLLQNKSKVDLDILEDGQIIKF